ncbi:membrane protein insertion efficiency factor YidD [Marinomonas atlantica]|uniref:membrane protein insertion efficiency factor YidD n=1 Tax=Marinomonas atlantica TaxID=1806668 RepID=UPI0009ED51AD|nr:membrane protein insertion efficiency factor YidD [Marinomonas atlantica]MCO4784570.1 membrane protein insertion efficiency factor YidD [Marinomonas atlantica]
MAWLQRFILHHIDRYQQKGGGTQQFGVSCNFTPTCSEYARQAILKYGSIIGCYMAIKRLRRCNERDRVDRIHDPVD